MVATTSINQDRRYPYNPTSEIDTYARKNWPVGTMVTRLSPENSNKRVIWHGIVHTQIDKVGLVELDNILYRVPLWNRITMEGEPLAWMGYQVGSDWSIAKPIKFRWYEERYITKSLNSEMSWIEVLNKGVDPEHADYATAGGETSAIANRPQRSGRSSWPIYESALNVNWYLDSYYTAQMPRMQAIADTVLLDRATMSTNVAWMSGAIVNDAIKRRLLDSGFTEGQADWFMARGRLSIDIFSPEGIRAGDQGYSRDPLPIEAAPPLGPQRRPTTITIKAPFGYLKPDSSLLPDMRPQLVQYYPGVNRRVDRQFGSRDPNRPHRNEVITPQVDVFHFPYTPQDIQYAGLGSEWTEIPRAADMPSVEWSRWHLMKATMEFLIAERMDGIFKSVHEELETLRRMAQRPYPISVYGMDSLLRISMRRAEQTGKPLEFVIADLSLGSLRRTMLDGDKEITAAQVKLTLQEIPIEEIRLARFPSPGFGEDVETGAVDTSGGCANPLSAQMSALASYHQRAGQNFAMSISSGDGCDPEPEANVSSGGPPGS